MVTPPPQENVQAQAEKFLNKFGMEYPLPSFLKFKPISNAVVIKICLKINSCTWHMLWGSVLGV